jgi:hypothetical protein
MWGQGQRYLWGVSCSRIPGGNTHGSFDATRRRVNFHQTIADYRARNPGLSEAALQTKARQEYADTFFHEMLHYSQIDSENVVGAIERCCGSQGGGDLGSAHCSAAQTHVQAQRDRQRSYESLLGGTVAPEAQTTATDEARVQAATQLGELEAGLNAVNDRSTTDNLLNAYYTRLTPEREEFNRRCAAAGALSDECDIGRMRERMTQATRQFFEETCPGYLGGRNQADLDRSGTRPLERDSSAIAQCREAGRVADGLARRAGMVSGDGVACTNTGDPMYPACVPRGFVPDSNVVAQSTGTVPVAAGTQFGGGVLPGAPTPAPSVPSNAGMAVQPGLGIAPIPGGQASIQPPPPPGPGIQVNPAPDAITQPPALGGISGEVGGRPRPPAPQSPATPQQPQRPPLEDQYVDGENTERREAIARTLASGTTSADMVRGAADRIARAIGPEEARAETGRRSGDGPSPRAVNQAQRRLGDVEVENPFGGTGPAASRGTPTSATNSNLARASGRGTGRGAGQSSEDFDASERITQVNINFNLPQPDRTTGGSGSPSARVGSTIPGFTPADGGPQGPGSSIVAPVSQVRSQGPSSAGPGRVAAAAPAPSLSSSPTTTAGAGAPPATSRGQGPRPGPATGTGPARQPAQTATMSSEQVQRFLTGPYELVRPALTQARTVSMMMRHRIMVVDDRGDIHGVRRDPRVRLVYDPEQRQLVDRTASSAP